MKRMRISEDIHFWNIVVRKFSILFLSKFFRWRENWYLQSFSLSFLILGRKICPYIHQSPNIEFQVPSSKFWKYSNKRYLRITLYITFVVWYVLFTLKTFLTWWYGPHRTSHDVFASLSINVKFLVFYVQFDERQPGVEIISAVKISGIHPRVSRGLYVASLQATIPEYPLAVRPVTRQKIL